MFVTVYNDVFSIAEKKYAGKVNFIFRQQVQPWHPSSTLTHEAGLAVLKLQPSAFWPFSKALFDKQTQFFDVNVVNEARNETYGRLAKLAASVGVDETKFLDVLKVSDKPASDGSLNIGNGVTDDLKVIVKVSLRLQHLVPLSKRLELFDVGRSDYRRSCEPNGTFQWDNRELYFQRLDKRAVGRMADQKHRLTEFKRWRRSKSCRVKRKKHKCAVEGILSNEVGLVGCASTLPLSLIDFSFVLFS
jgi:hypothetical protein